MSSLRIVLLLSAICEIPASGQDTGGSHSLLVRRDASTAPVTVRRESATIEEWHRYDPTTRGGVIGALLGSVAGAVIGYAVNDPPPPQNGCTPRSDDLGSALVCGFGNAVATSLDASFDEAGAVITGVVVGSLVGIFTGRAIGKSMVTEGWIPAGERLRLVLTPSRTGGTGVGISVSR